MPDLVPSRPLVKPPSRWRRWFRAVEFAMQLTLAAAYVLYAIRYYQITMRLKEALAEMDRTDPGWRLQDIEAARAVVPDAENSALLVMKAGKQLPDKWLDDDLVNAWLDLPPARRMDPAEFAHMRQTLDGLRPALEQARLLQDLPKGRFPIVYNRNPLSTLLPGRQKARALCALLQYDAMACAETDNSHAALSACRAALNAGRSIGDEPLAISQVIRMQCAMMTCKSVKRTLAQTEPASTDLKDMQELLEDESAHPYWLITLRGERALTQFALEPLESGEMSESEMTGDPPTWNERLFAFAFQDRVRANHPQLFAYAARFMEAAAMAPSQRRSAMLQIDREMVQAGLNPATMLLSSLPTVANAIARCQAAVRTHAAALAAERYRGAHGDWPQSLDLLTPAFITAVPQDPYTGDPLIYHHLVDGVVIYSVGTDGTDDGGSVDVANINEPGADIGVRLWDPAKRRQPPQPPAAPVPPR